MGFGRAASAFLRLLGIYVLMFLAGRIGFFSYFADPDLSTSQADYLHAFTLGLRFDLRIATFCALPALLLSHVPGVGWLRSKRARWAWLGLQTFITSWLVAIHFFDFGNYAYLEGRMSSAILENLRNPEIAAQMLKESYNLPLIIGTFLILNFAFFEVLRRFVFQPHPRPLAQQMWPRHLALSVATVLLIHGSLSQYPLRWSAAFFSTNNFVSSLALNPVHYFFDTLMSHSPNYDLELVEKYLPDMREHLGVEGTTEKKSVLFRQRVVSALPRLPKNTNVIYIVMESYAAAKMDTFGNGAGASKFMDELAARSWFFTNFYTPAEATARSMFCTVTGLNDISAESSSSRNPMAVHQNTLINALVDHQKFYFLGGSAAWGNIRGVFQNNIQNLEIYEESDFDLPKTDVWGLSDLDLFRETAKVLKAKAENGPFFALIQSASFHRPYTIPQDRGDFELLSLSEEELNRFGFHSNEEYNSFRFSDYALREFFRLIKNEAFFENTLFVIHGDHGLPDRDAAHLSSGYKKFGLSRFHVPLIFYSAKLPSPRKFDAVASQMDVLPSLMSVLGYEVPYQGLGQNFFARPQNFEPFVFSYVYYDRPVTKILLNERFLVTTDRAGEVAGLYDYTSATPDMDLRHQNPELFQKMSRLLHGYYESSRYLLHNNPKIDYSKD